MAIEMVNWLEIPVSDMQRARKFYEAVLDLQLFDMDVDGMNYPCFPDGKGGYSGALVQYDFTSPGNKGLLVYLNASPDVSTLVERVRNAGGNIIKNKEAIGEGMGYMAIFEDSEGNMLGLQGME